MDLVIRERVVRIVIIATSERIDAMNAPDFRQRVLQLVEDGANQLVIDLSEVPFMDSSGMAVLVSVLKRTRQAGGDVRLVWPKSEAARRILNLTKFDRVFEMADTAEAATRGFV